MEASPEHCTHEAIFRDVHHPTPALDLIYASQLITTVQADIQRPTGRLRVDMQAREPICSPHGHAWRPGLTQSPIGSGIPRPMYRGASEWAFGKARQAKAKVSRSVCYRLRTFALYRPFNSNESLPVSTRTLPSATVSLYSYTYWHNSRATSDPWWILRRSGRFQIPYCIRVRQQSLAMHSALSHKVQLGLVGRILFRARIPSK